MEAQYLRGGGTSYATILDNVRREHVMGMLVVKRVRLIEVASRVGFVSQASLSRAVRRWTGETSTQLRSRSKRFPRAAEDAGTQQADDSRSW